MSSLEGIVLARHFLAIREQLSVELRDFGARSLFPPCSGADYTDRVFAAIGGEKLEPYMERKGSLAEVASWAAQKVREG